ncbi:sprouty-related, EVH1 domain-containing protein 3 [Vombatus ursinus]|uniref:sprouty-related, EVH1 domain-containing protein 3 n=1 Tax=Vombatus ursinus TaxID=29139 RepID=UPI000FFCFD90|nr:sprouty-related, EVH1 domain-containing protein 3 [Vombatus ursinus]
MHIGALKCTLKPGLVYTKANLIFHYWQLDDHKFGLTFQSPADTDAFQKSMQTALAELVQGSHSSPSSSSSNTSQEPPDVLSIRKTHRNSQSSSSSIRQEARPPDPAIVTSQSSGLGPAMTSQRRPSPTQSPPQLQQLQPFPVRPEAPGTMAGWVGRGYEDYRRAGPPPVPLAVSCVMRFDKAGSIPPPGQAVSPTVPRTQASPPPPPPTPTPAQLLAKGSPSCRVTAGFAEEASAADAVRCVHCRALFRRGSDGRGRHCPEAPDPGGRLVRRLSCLWCAESLLYHCLSDAEGDFSDPCACEPGHPRPAARWAALAALSLAVPCLCCYPPLHACHWAAVRCGCPGCGGHHEAAR